MLKIERTFFVFGWADGRCWGKVGSHLTLGFPPTGLDRMNPHMLNKRQIWMTTPIFNFEENI